MHSYDFKKSPNCSIIAVLKINRGDINEKASSTDNYGWNRLG